MKHNILHQSGKLLVIAVITVFSMMSGSANAQSNKEEIDLYQSMFGVEKKALICDYLQIDSANTFWELYDEYETERKELGLQRLDLLNSYADNYKTLDDDKTDEIIEKSMKQKKELDMLIDKYYKKVYKASGSKVAAQFYQFENYVLSAVRLSVFENIPTIGKANL